MRSHTSDKLNLYGHTINKSVLNLNTFGHGQSHLKSETEGTSGPTKWSSVQQLLKKKTLL